MKRILYLLLMVITLTGCQNAQTGFVFENGMHINHIAGLAVDLPEGYIKTNDEVKKDTLEKLILDIDYMCFAIRPEAEDASYCGYILSLEGKLLSNNGSAYNRYIKAKTELEEALINNNYYDIVIGSETIEFSGEKLMCAKAEYKKDEKQHYALLYIANTKAGYCYVFTTGKTMEEAHTLMSAIKIMD